MNSIIRTAFIAFALASPTPPTIEMLHAPVALFPANNFATTISNPALIKKVHFKAGIPNARVALKSTFSNGIESFVLRRKPGRVDIPISEIEKEGITHAVRYAYGLDTDEIESLYRAYGKHTGAIKTKYTGDPPHAIKTTGGGGASVKKSALKKQIDELPEEPLAEIRSQLWFFKSLYKAMSRKGSADLDDIQFKAEVEKLMKAIELKYFTRVDWTDEKEAELMELLDVNGYQKLKSKS